MNIIVGTGTQVKTFKSHRKLLSTKSRYYRNNLKEDTTRSSFSLDDEDPNIYKRVQEWFYVGELLLPSEKSKDAERVDDSGLNTTSFPESIDEKLKKTVRSASHTNGGGFSPFEARYDQRFDSDAGSDASQEFVTQGEPPFPLDTLTLTKLYALAERLEISDLCDEVMTKLRQRLKHDTDTLGSALICAFERCRGPDNSLRGALTRFAAKSAPVGELMQQFGPDDLPPTLMFELLSQLLLEMGKLRREDGRNDSF